MTTTYVPLKYAKKAMREVREESLREGERRGYARATEFVRMASSLNGSTHAVLKALQEEGDGLATPRNRMVPVDGDGAAVDGAPDGDLDAVLMAALDALAEAKTHHPETDGGPVYAYLAGLLADPEALADALAEMDGGEVVGKSFDESKHPRGDNGRFIGREQIHAAKSDPKLADELRAKTTDPEQRKKLEAALKGDVDLGRTKAGEHRERVAKQRQDRAERVKRAQELANEISMWRRGGEAVPASHFRELAEVLPSMTVAELRSVRGKLAASFGGDRRKAEMAARLLEHAKNKAALLETNEKYDDMDALDFGSLHEYQNEGNAKGNEARNPNPEEQHGGRMQQRHDLMGAGAKGELNAPGKLSHGTPDTGSVLKLGDKPAPPQEPLSEPRQPAPSPAPSGEGATVAAHTTDKPEGGASVEKQPHEMTLAGLSATRRNHEPTGVKKGQLTKLPLNKLTFPIKWSSEVMPLKDNANEPLIVKKVGDKYQVIDGYGRTSGLRNAGATFAHAIVVSDSDLNQNQHGQGDDPQWVAEMHHKYAPKSAMAISPHEWRRREANQQQALKDAADRKAQEEIAERKRKEEYSRTPIDNMDVDQLKVALEPFGHISNFFGMREYDQLQSGNKEAVEKLRQIVRDKTAGGTLAAGKPVPPASDTPLSPAVHNAVKDAVKHHKRMQMPGKPVPQMVVYHVPEHRNTGGQLIEPAKVNAVPVNSYTGEQLLSGKLPHLKIEGTFEVGADGVPKKVEGGQAANFPSSQFSPEQAIKVAADDVSKLRKPDVFRAVEWAPTEHRAAVVDHIAKNRPDLHEELNAVADELGISSKPQMASTFSDADFENGNMHEKKVGNARLQYGVNENTGRAELYSLRVPQKDRGKGSAKQAMKEFLSEADRRGLPVELLASPLDKRTNLGKLVRFYESLGFKVVGRGNPAGDPKMIREPNGDTQRKAISTDWDDLRAELAVKRGIVHDDGATGV